MNNEIIKKLLDDLVDFKSNTGPNDTVFKFIGSEKDMEELFDKFDIDIDFINSPFFDEQMDYPFEEINEDEYTGDDVNHPDYGNRWTDWDSDISDYFSN